MCIYTYCEWVPRLVRGMCFKLAETGMKPCVFQRCFKDVSKFRLCLRKVPARVNVYLYGSHGHRLGSYVMEPIGVYAVSVYPNMFHVWCWCVTMRGDTDSSILNDMLTRAPIERQILLHANRNCGTRLSTLFGLQSGGRTQAKTNCKTIQKPFMWRASCGGSLVWEYISTMENHLAR